MSITIYIDIFFLWNLVIDYVILSVIVWVRKQKAGKGRRFLGAVTGSIAAVVILVLFDYTNVVYMVISYVITAVFILYITFGKCSKKLFVKNYLFFIITADCTAGILMSLGVFSNISMMDLIKGYMNKEEGLLNDKFIYMFFYIMSYVIPVFLFLKYKRKMPEDESCIYEVIIRYQQKDWRGAGFLDTGNLLFNPANGKPVVLLDREYFEELIGEGFEATEDALMNLPGACVIPFHSAGEQNGILYGVRITEISLFKNGEKWHESGIFAACCENLIPKGKGYQMLLNPKLIA